MIGWLGLSNPRRKVLLWVLAGLALAVHVQSLGAPFMLDDYAQAAMTEGRFGPVRSPLDLYDYIDDANRTSLFSSGAIPFWTDRHLVVRFLRPLASALRWLDHRGFGRHPFWQHAHSLLWWALATWAVHALLRRCFRPRPALFGTMAFALAPSHAMPLVWLANREVLVSTALGTWGLLAYLKWREGRRIEHGLAALGLFSVAVLAGEYTMCFAGYVAAMELVQRRESIWRRLLGIAVFALPAAAYVTAHIALGYDAHGSGFYRNPLHDVGMYARGMPRRLAILLGAAWLGTDDTWTASRWWALAVLGVGTVALLSVPLVRVVRGLDDEERRRATWMLGGSVLALGPVLSVEASNRLLDVTMVGVSACVGLVIDRAWFPLAPEPRRGAAELTGLVALYLAFAHFIRGPVDTLTSTRVLIKGARLVANHLNWVPEHVPRDAKTVFVVRADTTDVLLWGPFILGDAAPDRWRVMSAGAGRELLLRTGPQTVDLVASDRPLFHVGPDDLFRDVGQLRVGDTVTVPGMKATVMQLDENQMPRRLRFQLDASVDDPSYAWITEGEDGFREEKLPPVGYGSPIMP